MRHERRLLTFAAIALALDVGGPAIAQPQPPQACEPLLARDGGQTPIREAAARNLEASALGTARAAERRRTTEALIDAISRAGALDVARLCASLEIEAIASPVLLTGYYRPVVPARRSRDGQFRYPLYALPEPALRAHTRAEIAAGALDGRVAAVAWLADPVEAFFIHVQGSAVLELPGGRMAVGYAGSNGRPYTSIGALLVRDGRLQREDVSMQSLKAYLRDHPSERDAILHANERYIYFRRIDDQAIGSLGVPLTDGRSVAADPEVYPPGTLLFIDTGDASAALPPRLAVVQDRGSAITGPGRLDLYVGTGDEAARIAGPLQLPVRVFVLRAR